MQEQFLQFVASLLGVNRTQLSMDTAYQSIPEWDSLSHMRLIMEIEVEYGIEIPIELMAELLTLDALYARIPGGDAE